MQLKPVECSLYKPKKPVEPEITESKKEINEKEPKKDDDEEEEKAETEITTHEPKNIDEIEISWCEALKELKKRRLDKVAVGFSFL